MRKQTYGWGSITDLTLAALADLGRATAHEIADHLEIAVDSVRRTLHRMASDPPETRRVRVIGFQRTADGKREYPRQVFVLGPGRNASRPPPKPHREIVQTYRGRVKKQMLTTAPGITVRAALAKHAEMRRRGLI